MGGMGSKKVKPKRGAKKGRKGKGGGRTTPKGGQAKKAAAAGGLALPGLDAMSEGVGDIEGFDADNPIESLQALLAEDR